MSDRSIFTIDSHTLGEPTRVILSGFPQIAGKTMMDKKNKLQKNYDYLRRAVINEPRGHRDMFGACILKPIHKQADLGVVFMDGGGYLNMCGHGSMGVAATAVKQQLVTVTEPYTSITLDTPAGLVRTKVKVKNGRAEQVHLVNVPAFLYRENVKVFLKGSQTINVDIAFGGNFFALVNAQAAGIPLEIGNMEQLLKTGLAIRAAVNRQVNVRHPLLPDIHSVDLVEFFEPLPAMQPDEAVAARNVVVFGHGQIDRSPCGTGTSAKLAVLYANGSLKIGQTFTNESILGTRFTGRVIKTTIVDHYPAIIPEITGQVYVTGENKLILDDRDPFAYGINWNEHGRVQI